MTPEDILRHPASILTAAQRAAFFEDGYLCLEGLIAGAALGAIRTAMADLVEKSRGLSETTLECMLAPGHTAESPRLIQLRQVVDTHPAFRDYTSRGTLVDVAADLVGPDVRFREAYINCKWAGAGKAVSWHQDFPFFPVTNRAMITTLTYLEDVTPEMGPIMVVPGSHRGVLYDHYDGDGNWIGRLRDDDLAPAGIESAVELAGPAGTVAIFDASSVHGSRANLTDRGRPALVTGYAAADAYPYNSTPPPMKTRWTWDIVRGQMAPIAHLAGEHVRVPPDWGRTGYVSPDWPEKNRDTPRMG
jgi:ectoine hydroxylase-related dioxygenase (phytanoyl-CoA dioxygenase family)